MAKKEKIKLNKKTNPFTAAHYILLFLVVVLCIAIIAWIMISKQRQQNAMRPAPVVTHVQNTDPCVQDVRNIVAQMWAYNSEQVPQKYWDIANGYLNQQITTRQSGVCADVAFVCKPGQRRIECDPCAVPSARMVAQDQQVTDLIQQYCD